MLESCKDGGAQSERRCARHSTYAHATAKTARKNFTYFCPNEQCFERRLEIAKAKTAEKLVSTMNVENEVVRCMTLYHRYKMA